MKALPSIQHETFAITDLGAHQLREDLERATARFASFTADDLVDDTVDASPLLDIIGEVAVISVSGMLLRSENFLSWIFGYSTYDGIWHALEVAIADKNVKAILLRMNSPGGVTTGLGELADFIASIAKRMPVWVYVESMCASAAYWLGSQATHIVAYQTAEIGCIGTRYGLIDDSARDALMGIKRHDLVNDQSPAKRELPVDDEVIKRIKVRLTDNSAVFIAAVATGREIDEQDVIDNYGKGDVMIAEKALSVGMIDQVGNFNSTLAALQAAVSNSNGPQTRAQRGSMATKDPKIAAAQAAVQEGVTVAAATSDTATPDEEKCDHPWDCKECSEQMGPEADAYCLHCYGAAKEEEPDGDEDEDEDDDQDEESKALASLGLLGKTRSETRANLVAFAKATCKMLGAVTATEAEGKAKAGAEALEQLRKDRDAAAEGAKAKAKADVISAVEAAVKGGKITLAEVGGIVDFMANEQEGAKITAALNATMIDPRDPKKERTIAAPQTLETVKAALASAIFDDKDARRITSYLGAKGVKLPAAHREPPDTQAARRDVHRHLARSAQTHGVSQETVEDLGALSITEIERRVEAKQKAAANK